MRPGKGREGTAFRIARSADRTYVVPRDAERLLANGTADRRLFDVTQLVKWGYDDAARPDLPLIVTYVKGRTLTPSTLSAMRRPGQPGPVQRQRGRAEGP